MLRQQAKLCGDLELLGLIDGELGPEDFQFLLYQLRRLLPRVHISVLQASCQYLAGAVFSQQALSALAWRLAGNLHRLRAGQIVLPWDGQPSAEWVPIHCLELIPWKSRRGKGMGQVHYRVLAGLPAGVVGRQALSRGYVRLLAPALGFSRFPSEPYFLQDMQELAGLRCYVQLVPGPQLSFSDARVPSSFRAWNQRLLRMRRRAVSGFACPQGHPASFPCHRCPTGREHCSLAVHLRDYVPGDCRVCDERSWLRVPGDKLCVNCQARLPLERPE